MSELTDFLEARLADSEALLVNAVDSWEWFDGRLVPARELVADQHDALRSIVAWHVPDGLEPDVCAVCASHVELWPCRTVRALAAPYRDHPGYQEGWAL